MHSSSSSLSSSPSSSSTTTTTIIIIIIISLQVYTKKIKTSKYGNWSPLTVVGLNPKITWQVTSQFCFWCWEINQTLQLPFQRNLNLFCLWWSFNRQCYLDRKLKAISSKGVAIFMTPHLKQQERNNGGWGLGHKHFCHISGGGGGGRDFDFFSKGIGGVGHQIFCPPHENVTAPPPPPPPSSNKWLFPKMAYSHFRILSMRLYSK